MSPLALLLFYVALGLWVYCVLVMFQGCLTSGRRWFDKPVIRCCWQFLRQPRQGRRVNLIMIGFWSSLALIVIMAFSMISINTVS